MTLVKPLPACRLHATFDASRLEWEDSTQIRLPNHGKSGRDPFQHRVMHALDLALQIQMPGYHVYLSGEADLGRTYTLLSYLTPRAARLEAAPDLVYVQNFVNPDKPLLLSLPAGQGQKFRQQLKNLIAQIDSSLENVLESTPFQEKRAYLFERYHKKKGVLLDSMHGLAREKGYNLDMDEAGGISLSPMKDRKKPSDASINLDIERHGNTPLSDSIARNLLEHLQKINRLEESFNQQIENLEREAMQKVLDSIFPDFKTSLYTDENRAKIDRFLLALKEDLLDNSSAFLPSRAPGKNPENQHNPENSINSRYEVNIFVDNSTISGAPIIQEDNPTLANLMGCIERESELGALITDFSLIRSGSLQKANGGFLILHVEDILQHPQSWDALLRSLRSNLARIDDLGELSESFNRTKSLSPEPLPLNLKVILIGSEDFYEELLENDDRFGKLFRIKAHMTDEAMRNATNIKYFLFQIARIIQQSALLPFTRDALAWLVDLGSHLCEDQKRLSLKFPLIRNFMVEASALARSRKHSTVDSAVLEETYTDKIFRANLVEELFMEDYDRQMIKVDTSGSAIGQVNGLAVTVNGDFEFGLPHRISCAVGVGHDGIIDLERESELGGPIHTKAMLILKGYLTRLFARKKPLVLNASLYFEQSYAGIEGDSASGAELVALLSALADVPVRLDLAFTGALSHTGQIMAVGGITRKIEGFYKVCSRKGLTGTQGVIIPFDNVDHLMLSTEILDSVEKRLFSIYAVKSIEDALFLLTGMPAGKSRKNGSFTPGSLFDLVDRRLELLGCHAQNSFRRVRKD